MESIELTTSNQDNKTFTPEDPKESQPRSELRSCTYTLFTDSLPYVINLIGSFIVTTLNLIYFSNSVPEQVAPDAIAGVGIAVTWTAITTFVVIMSLNGGFSTLAAQAFGSKNYELVGLYLHRSLIIRTLCLIPGFILLIYCEECLLALGVSERPVIYAGMYARALIPGTFLLMLGDTFKAYIIAHNIFKPLLYIQIIIMGSHFLFCELLIRKLQLGMTGVGWAFFLSQGAGVAAYASYIFKYQPTKETLFWFKKESFQNLLLQFKQEAWIAMFMYLEWVGYEFILIFGGMLGDLELRSLVICYNIATFVYMPGSGLAMTLTTYTATAMGEGNLNRVMKFIQGGAILTFADIILVSGALFIFAEPLIRIYTNDEETVEYSVVLLRLYGGFYFLDLGQIMEVAVLKGTGKEVIGTKYYIISMLIVGPISGYALAFWAKFRAIGLYIGLAIGLATMNVLCFLVLKRMDFREQMKEIQARINELSPANAEKAVEMKEIHEQINDELSKEANTENTDEMKEIQEQINDELSKAANTENNTAGMKEIHSHEMNDRC